LTIRRTLAQARPEVYLPYVAGTLNNLGNVLSDLNELEAAKNAYLEGLLVYDGKFSSEKISKESLARYKQTIKDNPGVYQLKVSEAHVLLARLELDKATHPNHSYIREQFTLAIEACENGLENLAETLHRDLFKGKIEYAYLWLIEENARAWRPTDRTYQDELIRLLEALRQVETLAGFAATPEETRAIARQKLEAVRHGMSQLTVYLTPNNAAFLWIQRTLNAVVFVAQTPDGVHVALAPVDAHEKLIALNAAMQVVMDLGYTPEKDKETTLTLSETVETAELAHKGDIEWMVKNVVRQAKSNIATRNVVEVAKEAFTALPETIQIFLTNAKHPQIHIAACRLTVNHLWELLQTSSKENDYLGLQKQLPRIHSALNLMEVKDRTPQTTQGQNSALIVGDPNSNLPSSGPAATNLATNLTQPGNTLLLGQNVTVATMEMALATDFALWVQIGHGTHLALALSDGLLLPEQIRRYNWLATQPIIHHACCLQSWTYGTSGGRFESHPTAALTAGAACVLSSTMELFDKAYAEFIEVLYQKALDKTKPLTYGQAVLETRRAMAAKHPNSPMVWAQYALWGNPHARLV
jgi:hypothetical protein